MQVCWIRQHYLKLGVPNKQARHTLMSSKVHTLSLNIGLPSPAQGVLHKKLFLSLNYPSVHGSSPNLDLGHQTELCVLWECEGSV